MCALFGYLDYGHKVSIRFLQKLVQALAPGRRKDPIVRYEKQIK